MIKKYPFIRQPGLKDCGVACTFMIIKYYNGYIGLNQLSELLKTSRQGTTAYHIIKALKLLGFEAYGIKGKYHELKTQPIPFIASVIINNSYKHFVVVYEIHDNYLLIADPAKKINKVLVEDFQKIWTGVSLHMYPVKPIVKMKECRIFAFLVKLVISNLKYLIPIFILSIATSLFSTGISFFFQVVIDNIHKSNLKTILIFFLTIYICKIILDFFRNLILICLNKKMDQELTNWVLKKIIYLPYNYYHDKTTGEVISRIDDMNYVRRLFNNGIIRIFIDLPLLIIILFILLYLNSKLFVIAMITLVIYVLIIFLTKNKLTKRIFNEGVQKSVATSYMTEIIKGFETIKGLGVENKLYQKFKKKYKQKIKANYELDKFYNYLYLVQEFINICSQMTILFLGIILVKKGALSLGSLMTYLILTSYFLMGASNILNFNLEFKEAKEAINRILDLTYYKNEEVKLPYRLSFDIKINHLNYSFDDVTNILKDICLDIKKGEKILINGPSGSGKSTLLKIIKKFYKVENDKVKIGDIDINHLTHQEIDKNIVYIGQNETFFTGSLLENLTLRGNNYKKAMYLSESADILNKDSLGYYMLIEENGFNLSGGQKQRLALARALQNFEIILIDEGFSGVDASAERKILKNILNFYKHKTIIVISHRLDNLDLFSRYIKMHSGKIIIDEKRR